MFELADEMPRRQIIGWWEKRLPNYNLLILAVGIFAWFAVLIAGSQAVRPGVDFEEPIAMIIGPPVYAVIANICYHLGPLLDIVFYAGRPRVGLFKAGLIFSLMLTSLPGIWAIVAWLITLSTGHKLP
jgi:hypothetical protein